MQVQLQTYVANARVDIVAHVNHGVAQLIEKFEAQLDFIAAGVCDLQGRLSALEESSQHDSDAPDESHPAIGQEELTQSSKVEGILCLLDARLQYCLARLDTLTDSHNEAARLGSHSVPCTSPGLQKFGSPHVVNSDFELIEEESPEPARKLFAETLVAAPTCATDSAAMGAFDGDPPGRASSIADVLVVKSPQSRSSDHIFGGSCLHATTEAFDGDPPGRAYGGADASTSQIPSELGVVVQKFSNSQLPGAFDGDPPGRAHSFADVQTLHIPSTSVATDSETEAVLRSYGKEELQELLDSLDSQQICELLDTPEGSSVFMTQLLQVYGPDLLQLLHTRTEEEAVSQSQ